MVIVSRLIAKFNSYYADKPGMRVSCGRLCSWLQLTVMDSPYHHDYKRRMSTTLEEVALLEIHAEVWGSYRSWEE